MHRIIFGRHLYNQIVMPLVVASLVVGVVATIVAVYFLSNLTDTWVDQVAENSVTSLQERFEQRGDALMQSAQATAQDLRLRDSLARGDLTRARELMVQMNQALKYNNMMLLNEDGTIIVSTGLAGVLPGQTISTGLGDTFDEISAGHPALLDLDDRMTITAVEPIPAGGSEYRVALSTVVDDEYLTHIVGSVGGAMCVYDHDLQLQASALTLPADARPEEASSLEQALDGHDAGILEALEQARYKEAGTGTLRLGDVRYRVRAARMHLATDPQEENFGYAVSVVNQAVSDQAGRTTTNLITMWSIFAVLALAGLGGWVARRVSDPLIELTSGARRIADGDFTTKIDIKGANEISDLADTFNQMTDSLRERSDSLTKKVLELATLYEMSRALGSTLDMEVLLDSVLDSALRIFDLDAGYVTLRDRDTGRLELKAWRAVGAAQPDEEALRNSMSEWVIREGRPLIFNPSADGGQPEHIDQLTGALAALCVPLVSAEGALGAIIVGSHDPGFRFTSDDVRLLSTIANHVTIAIGNIELFTSLQEAYLATVRSLAAAVDAKDPYTRGHSDRVAQFAALLAERAGLSHEQRTALEMAAYLHDIGKIGIKEEILLKPGRLTDAEMGQMRHHPLIGANILKPVGFPWPITPVVRHHHERWDGGGYPAGLKGEEIPLLARILTVADAYEAMVSDRPYRLGRTREEGVEELRRCAGSQFDPRLTEMFIEVLESHQTEELVQPEPLEEAQRDEVRAIFVAICEGMMTSFRRLGGPRLAANVEREINAAFADAQYGIEVSAGHVSVRIDGELAPDDELRVLRSALRLVDETMGRMSGHTLVDHFYADAVAALSDRMRRLVDSLQLYLN